MWSYKTVFSSTLEQSEQQWTQHNKEVHWKENNLWTIWTVEQKLTGRKIFEIGESSSKKTNKIFSSP